MEIKGVNENLYIGGKLVSRVNLGNKTVFTGFAQLPEIPLPFYNVGQVFPSQELSVKFPPVPSTDIPTISKRDADLIAGLGIITVSLEGFKLECSGTLPTKADIVNAFNKLLQIPSKIKAQIVAQAKSMAKDVIDDLMRIVKDIEDVIEKISDILSPFWEKGEVRDWQKEAKDAWDELIQQYHIYIPTKMLEMISKLIPIDFNVNILGIEINLLKIATAEEKKKVQDQIKGKLDHFYAMLPEPLRFYDGEWGVKCDEWKAKLTWQYFLNKVIQFCTGLLVEAFNKLIKKFKSVWDALGLPSIPDLLTFDFESWLDAQLKALKTKAENEMKRLKDKVDKTKQDIEDLKNFSVAGYVKKELEKITIFGKPLLDIIGGEIDENSIKGEELIADLSRQALEWFAQWQKELILMWVKKIKKFLDKIGLGKLLDLLTLTFCDVLELIGVPTSFDLKLSV